MVNLVENLSGKDDKLRYSFNLVISGYISTCDKLVIIMKQIVDTVIKDDVRVTTDVGEQHTYDY